MKLERFQKICLVAIATYFGSAVLAVLCQFVIEALDLRAVASLPGWIVAIGWIAMIVINEYARAVMHRAHPEYR